MKIISQLSEIQAELKVPKNQFNAFGKYKYRSCEDILEATKNVCKKHSVVLIISDEVVIIGDRIYVKSTATVYNNENEHLSAVGFARESVDKKGMDHSQITGATSSYARKYALNGLFCIDDTKDADTTNNGTSEQPYISQKQLHTLTDMVLAVNADEEKFCQFLKIESLDKLPSTKFNQALAALKSKEKK